MRLLPTAVVLCLVLVSSTLAAHEPEAPVLEKLLQRVEYLEQRVGEVDELRHRLEQLEASCRRSNTDGHKDSLHGQSVSTLTRHSGRQLLSELSPLSGNITQSGTQFSQVVVDSGVILQDVADPSAVVDSSSYNMLFANGGRLYFRSSSGSLTDVLAKDEAGDVNGTMPFWYTDSSLKVWHTFEADTIVGSQYVDKASSLATRDGAGTHSSASGVRGLGVYSPSSNYLLTGYTVPQTDRSVSFWVKYTAFTGSYQLMGVQLGYGHLYIGMSNQQPPELYYFVSNEGGALLGYGLSIDHWYHMGITMGQNVAHLYLDGEVILTRSYSTVTNVDEYGIGGLQNGQHRLEAVVDELKIWDRVVSATEMREVFDYEKATDVKETYGQTQPWVDDVTLRVWHTFDADTVVGGGQYRDLAASIVTNDLTGTHSAQSSGFIGQALRSSSSNVVDLNYYNPVNEKTVTYWIYYHSFPGQYSLMGSQGNGAFFYLGVDVNHNVYYFAGQGTGGTVSPTVTLNAGTWYWFGMKMTGSVVKIFLDGNEILSTTYSAPSSQLKFAIGGLQNQNHPMDISIDEFKLWARALPDSDLMDIYQYETAIGNH